MIVYHGSDFKFDMLRICPEYTHSVGGSCYHGVGIYFTDSKRYARSYGRYIYEIEIPDELVVRISSRSDAKKYIDSFFAYVSIKTGINLYLFLRDDYKDEHHVSENVDALFEEYLADVFDSCGTNGFTDWAVRRFHSLWSYQPGFFMKEYGISYKTIALIVRAWREFDADQQPVAYWFDGTHRGVIKHLVDEIRLVSRMDSWYGMDGLGCFIFDFATGKFHYCRDGEEGSAHNNYCRGWMAILENGNEDRSVFDLDQETLRDVERLGQGRIVSVLPLELLLDVECFDDLSEHVIVENSRADVDDMRYHRKDM